MSAPLGTKVHYIQILHPEMAVKRFSEVEWKVEGFSNHILTLEHLREHNRLHIPYHNIGLWETVYEVD